MRTSHAIRFMVLAALGFALAATSGCGEEKKEGPERPAKKEGGSGGGGGGGGGKSKEKTFTPVAKPHWDAVSPHFMAYVDGLRADLGGPLAGSSIRDVFLDFTPKAEAKKGTAVNVVKSQPRAVTEEKKRRDAREKAQKDIDSILAAISAPPKSGSSSGGGKDGVALGPKDPLTAFPLNRYSVKIVMTGVANPEAVIEAPDGKTHVVHRGDRLGSEGGLVVDVLKSKVLFRLPDREELVEVVMAPEITPTLLEGGAVSAKNSPM